MLWATQGVVGVNLQGIRTAIWRRQDWKKMGPHRVSKWNRSRDRDIKWHWQRHHPTRLPINFPIFTGWNNVSKKVATSKLRGGHWEAYVIWPIFYPSIIQLLHRKLPHIWPNWNTTTAPGSYPRSPSWKLSHATWKLGLGYGTSSSHLEASKPFVRGSKRSTSLLCNNDNSRYFSFALATRRLWRPLQRKYETHAWRLRWLMNSR